MRALTGELLLAAWEAGSTVPDLHRPLALLACARPGAGPASAPKLASMPIAARDRERPRLRELTFGPWLAVVGSCPACGERLEFTLDGGELAAGLEAAATAGPVEWTEDGHGYRLRPVTTDDLLATLHLPDAGEAQDLLLARCLEDLGDRRTEDGAGCGTAPFPASVVKRFEELHADGEIRCAVDCPACGARHLHELDIARFLWREVAVAARRLLAEVHVLASAYGWREQDILELSPRRRAAYLELVGQ